MNERVPIEADLPELREMLVAYLDGELDGASARHVEELLARDPRVELELHQLERAWQLLDRLPRAEVDPSFTQSTVEMAVVAVADELQPAAAVRGRRAALVVTVLLAAGFSGFFGARLWPDANRQLLLDLPILENLEAYRQSPSIDFVRQLVKAGLFADAPADAMESTGAAEGHLESLNSDQKEKLHRDYERFVHLPADEQERLRKLHAAMEVDERASQLKTTLARFQHWLEKLPGVERAELIALESEQRFARIRRMREDEARRLNTADLQVFVDWFQTQLMKWLPEPRRRQLQQRLAGQPEPVRREILGRTLGELRKPQNMPPGRPPFAGLAALLNKEQGVDLHQQLSPRGQQQLDRAETLEERRLLMQTWIAQAFSPPALARGAQLLLPEASDEELKKFFDTQLDPGQRAQLLNLPADQMQRQLRLRYHQWKRGAPLNRPPSEKRANDE